jgi:hypothetical protein
MMMMRRRNLLIYRFIHENGDRDKGGDKNGRDEPYTNIRYESMIVNFVDGDAIVATGLWIGYQ